MAATCVPLARTMKHPWKTEGKTKKNEREKQRKIENKGDERITERKRCVEKTKEAMGRSKENEREKYGKATGKTNPPKRETHRSTERGGRVARR